MVTKLTEKGPDFQWPLASRIEVLTSSDIMQIAPLPPFLILDGLVGDISAALVYERVLYTDTEELPLYQHAKQFLLACLSKNNLPDPKPHVNPMCFMQLPSAAARKWAMKRFKDHFSSLIPPPPAPPAGIPALPPPLPPTPTPDLAAQITAYLAVTGGNHGGSN